MTRSTVRGSGTKITSEKVGSYNKMIRVESELTTFKIVQLRSVMPLDFHKNKLLARGYFELNIDGPNI